MVTKPFDGNELDKGIEDAAKKADESIEKLAEKLDKEIENEKEWKI